MTKDTYERLMKQSLRRNGKAVNPESNQGMYFRKKEGYIFL